MPVAKNKGKSVGAAGVSGMSPRKTSRTSAEKATSSADSGKTTSKKTSAEKAVKPLTRTAREPLSPEDMNAFRRDLVKMRDRLTGMIVQIRNESLTREDEVNPEEDGTDAFERLFALERASSDQDMIFNIDAALRAIDEGNYGVCEMCGCMIEKARLEALPFAKNCIKCQSELEMDSGGRRSGSRG